VFFDELQEGRCRIRIILPCLAFVVSAAGLERVCRPTSSLACSNTHHPAVSAGGASVDALAKIGPLAKPRRRFARTPEFAPQLQLSRRARLHLLYRFRCADWRTTVNRAAGAKRCAGCRRRSRRRAVSVAVDGNGLSYNFGHHLFIRRMNTNGRPHPRHRHWLKCVILRDVQQPILFCCSAAGSSRARSRRALSAGLLTCGTRSAPRVGVWRMRSLTPNPITTQFGNAWGLKASPLQRPGSPMEPFAIRLSCSFPLKTAYRHAPKIETIFSVVKRQLSSRSPGVSLATRFAKPSSSASS